MVQIEEENVKRIFGIATWGWWFVGFLFFVFSLLANYKNGLQFNGTVIFALIWVIGIVLLVTLPHSKHRERFEGTQNLDVFWLENPNKHVIWIPIVGFLGVLGSSYAGSVINQPIAGIFGSGIIMLITLFYTRSILVPIIIHGAFNVFVILGQSGYLGNSFLPLALNPSFSYGVPIVGNAIPTISPIISEIMNQLFLVSPAEEIMKVVAIAGFIVFFRGYYSQNTAIKWLAGLGAVLIWSFMHSVQAL